MKARLSPHRPPVDPESTARSISVIQLRAMTDTEFVAFETGLIQDYAQDIARNHKVPLDEARAEAQQQIAGLLPDGSDSRNQQLFTIVPDATQEAAGYLWCQVEAEKQRAFICEIQIFDRYRSHGYGTAALRELEHRLRTASIRRVGLHVFGDNTRAQALYRQLGYRVTGMEMQKELGDQ